MSLSASERALLRLAANALRASGVPVTIAALSQASHLPEAKVREGWADAITHARTVERGTRA